MTVSTTAIRPPRMEPAEPPIRLGGYAALAESAWMGSVQATEVLDNLQTAPAATPRRVVVPRLPRLALRSLLSRELSVAEASFVLMASFFVSAALGAVRQVLFNAQFGVGMEANAYYAAFRLPDTLFSLIAGGALSSAMIPVLIRTEQQDGPSSSARFVQLILTTLLAVFGVIVLVAELLAPTFTRSLLAPGFDPATSQLTVSLTRIMLLQPIILAAGTVAAAILNSRNQFVLTALSVVSHNVALIVGILAAGAIPQLGIYGPTLGVVVGALLQLLILLPGLAMAGASVRPVWDPLDHRLHAVVRLLIPNGLSVSVNYAGFIVDTSFASRAPEAAALPAIYNAWLLVGLPIALLGQAVGQAVFPRLASHAASMDWSELRRTLFRSLGAVVALAIPAQLAILVVGRQVIALLFERGSFTRAAGDLTYTVLLTYTIALPAYVCTEVITRGLLALEDTRTPLITNIGQLAGRVLILTLFVDTLGVSAIPIALAVTAAMETLLLGAMLLRQLHRRRVANLEAVASRM